MEAGHHHRARHLAAGCLHQVAKQPAPQPGRGIQPHHHQVRILLKGRCGYAAGDIAVHPQQRLAQRCAAGALKPLPAGAALLWSHHLERHQPAWHGALAVRQQAGQLDQPPFPGWIGDRHQHRQPPPFQGSLERRGLRPWQQWDRPGREPGPQAGRDHHQGQHPVEHLRVEQAAAETHKGGGQGGGHLGQGERPHRQDLGAAVAVEAAGPPGGQPLGADQGGDQQQRKRRAHHGAGEHRQVQHQAQVDEEDRDEQARSHHDHLLPHPPLRQHRIDGQAGQEGADDLFHAGQFGGQGRQKYRQQHRHKQLAVVVDAALHQAAAETGDHQHHQGGVDPHPQQQPPHPQGTQVALGQAHAEGEHHQGGDVGHNRAADGHGDRLLPHRSVAAHDRVAQGGMGGEDRADQHRAQ